MGEELRSGNVVLGRFAVEQLAGCGGMGSVYRAVDQKTGLPVALKVLHSDSDEARFHREARLLSELRHPGIVGYVHHGHTESGQPFLAMDWLQGHDLAHRLSTNGLSLSETMRLARRVAEALAEAHRAGIVHRDIKPSNLFLLDGDPSRTVLLDFGIARRSFGGRSLAMTHTGAIVGTPEYMAPEQARGDSQLGAATDVFSLGCVLYECLSGNPPFVAAHIAAVLAKILFEEAPKLRSFRPELPTALETLLEKMLVKDARRRLPDGQSVLRELLNLPELPTLNAPVSNLAAAPPSLQGGEQHLVCVLLISEGTEILSSETLAATEDVQQKAQLETLRAHLSNSGIRLERLADGSVLGTLRQHGVGAATDLAALGARSALFIHERWNAASIAIATGKGVLAGDFPVGEAVDRAAMLLRLRTTKSGAVFLDELTAGLLDARFEVQRLSTGVFSLLGEKLLTDETRKLLGKPTPCLGREQELLVLSAMFQGCIEEPAPRVALVVAPAGFGKSRLRHEFFRRIAGPSEAVLGLMGRADAMNPGAPYGVWTRLFRELLDRGPTVDQTSLWSEVLTQVTKYVDATKAVRVSAFLLDLAGLPVPSEVYPPLHAARANSRLFFEQATLAIADFLSGACEQQPVVLFFEDLQWGDAQSIELTEAVLRLLPDSPLLLLALARPEYEQRLPKLGKDRGLQEIHLGGLGKRAAERLVKTVLGPNTPTAAVSRILEQAAGNPLYLEELVRAFAEGKTAELPDTVLAMLQARVGRLPPEQRRVLRAASLFGTVFPRSGVLALIGGTNDDGTSVDRVLRELTEAEIIERIKAGLSPDEAEYGIRHSLLREAAYSLLTDEDRRLGHRLCAEFLKQRDPTDHTTLARHFELGGEFQSALRHYIEAAVNCWRHFGIAATRVLCDAALKLGATGESLGAIRCIEAQMALYQGQLSDGVRYAQEGMALCVPGSRFYYWAMLSLIANATLSGQVGPLAKLLREFDDTEPAEDATWFFLESACIVAQIRAYLGLRESALHLIGRLKSVYERSTDLAQKPLFLAAVQRAQGIFDFFLTDNQFGAIAMLKEAAETHSRFGQLRAASLLCVDVVFALIAVGDCDSTVPFAQKIREFSRQLGDLEIDLSVEIVECANQLRTQDPQARARIAQRLGQVIEQSHEDRVRPGQALLVLGMNHLQNAAWSEATAAFDGALSAMISLPVVTGSILTFLALCHLQLGQTQQAQAAVEQGLGLTQLLGDLGPFAAGVWVAHAQVEQALGHQTAAKTALRRAIELLQRLLSKAPTADARKNLLSNVLHHALIVQLAKAWFGEDVGYEPT